MASCFSSQIYPVLSRVAAHQELSGTLAFSTNGQEFSITCEGRQLRLHLRKASRAFLVTSGFRILKRRYEIRRILSALVEYGWTLSIVGRQNLVDIGSNKTCKSLVQVSLERGNLLKALVFGVSNMGQPHK